MYTREKTKIDLFGACSWLISCGVFLLAFFFLRGFVLLLFQQVWKTFTSVALRTLGNTDLKITVLLLWCQQVSGCPCCSSVQ